MHYFKTVQTINKNKKIQSVYNFISAATAGKCFRFGFKCEAHSQNITHCFLQCIVAFKLRIGVNVGMYFHFNAVFNKQIAQLVSNFNAFGNFYQHTFFNVILLPRFVVMNVHKATAVLTQKNNYVSKLCFFTFNLAVCANTYFQANAFFRFPLMVSSTASLIGSVMFSPLNFLQRIKKLFAEITNEY